MQHTNIEQAFTQQVGSAYLDTVTFTHQITLAVDVVKTADDAVTKDLRVRLKENLF